MCQYNVTITRTTYVKIDNYADRPDDDLLREYIIILRKDKNNFNYDPREQEEDEEPDDYISNTYKHYIIRCQMRSIEHRITTFENRYYLSNTFKLLERENP